MSYFTALRALAFPAVVLGAVLGASAMAPAGAAAQPLPFRIPGLAPREAPAASPDATSPAAPDESAARAVETVEPEPLPRTYEVVPRSLALEEEAERVRAELARPIDRDAVERELETLQTDSERLRQRLAVVVGEGPLDGERLARLRARAQKDRARLEEVLAAASARYRRLEQLAVDWQMRRELFTRWRESLAADPAHGALAEELSEALAEIEGVEAAIGAAVPAAREAQQSAQALVREGRDLEVEIDRILGQWEASLRRPSGPPMVVPAFFAELRQTRVPEGAELPPPPGIDAAFVEDQAPTLLLQLVVGLLVAFGARWLDRAAGPEHSWHNLLAHPWALGVFAAVAGFGSLYDPAPGLWRLLPAVLLAASVARLARGTFARPRERWAIYAFAFLHLAFEAAETLGLAEPAARLVLLALAVVPLALLIPILVKEHREHGRLTYFGVLLRLGAALLAVLAVAEIAGFHPLARWLYQAGLHTTIVLFVSLFALRLGEKLVRYLLGLPAFSRTRLLSRMREELTDRLLTLLKVLVIAGALLFLADTWHLADSPFAAFGAVLRWDVSFGGYRVTAGQVLLAAVALYLAAVVSWLLRAALDERVAHGLSLDRGVADSVKTLIRYSTIVVGFFLALSLLGIDLSSFAILAGAFGVGIGFGMQNVISNFVSGLILLFERPVRAGDSVVVAGEAGVIQRIGLRSTVMLTGDRAEVIVPNNLLISEKVTNWTRTSRAARLTVQVRVVYGTDLKKVAELLAAIARDHPKVLPEPRPVAQVVTMNENAIVFELRAFVADVEQRADVQSDLLAAIAERFAAEGIAFPSQPWAARSVSGDTPASDSQTTDPHPDTSQPEPPSEEDRP